MLREVWSIVDFWWISAWHVSFHTDFSGLMLVVHFVMEQEMELSLGSICFWHLL